MWLEHLDFELADLARLRRLVTAVEALRVALDDNAAEPYDETDPKWRAFFAPEDLAYFTEPVDWITPGEEG